MDLGNDELYRIDPTSNQIIATIPLRARPRALAAGDGSVWVFNEGDGILQRIDGKSGKQLAAIETDALGKALITVGGGFVWVATQSGGITQIDPRTDAVRGKFKINAGNYVAFNYADSSLWICGSEVYRITSPK